jgi:hypothetical protein
VFSNGSDLPFFWDRLNSSDISSIFVLIKVRSFECNLTVDAEFKQLLNESKKVNMSRSSSRAKITDHRHRKTEQEEDAELLQDEEDEEDERTMFRESPACSPTFY